MNRITITGATGFIGSHLTEHFVSQGWEVVGLCRRPPDREQNPGVEFVSYDLGKQVPQDALAGCSVLVHCAHVLYSRRHPDADKLNSEGSRRLFRAAERASVGKILYLSSLSAHPEVQSHYGKSKLEVESLLNPERDTILRLGLVLGPGGFAGRLQAVLARTRIVPLIDSGRQPVYAIHIEDLCRVVKSLILTPDTGILQIGHPRELTVGEVNRTLARAMRRRVLFLPFPFRLLHPLVSLAERFGVELPVTSENLLGLAGARPLDLTEDVGRLRVTIKSFEELLRSGAFEEWIPRQPARRSRLLHLLRPTEAEILDYARAETNWQSGRRFRPLTRGPVVAMAVLAGVGLAAAPGRAAASAAQGGERQWARSDSCLMFS